MVPRLVLLCVGIVVLQSTACAQDVNAPVNIGQLEKLRADMKADMKAEIRAAIAQALGQAGGQQNGGLVPVPPVPTVEQRLTALEQGQTKLARELGNQGNTLGEIAMMDETGKHHVQFDTNSQSARNELQRAIKNTVPKQGQFIIRNRTPWLQTLIVNGYEQRIAPYDTISVPVNPGTIMSWLPGDQKYTWHIGLPDFKQVVELQQREPSYVARWVGY